MQNEIIASILTSLVANFFLIIAFLNFFEFIVEKKVEKEFEKYSEGDKHKEKFGLFKKKEKDEPKIDPVSISEEELYQREQLEHKERPIH